MGTPLTKQRAQVAFAFLERGGFKLEPGGDLSRFESDLSWELRYSSPKVAIRVLFDMHQFEVNFSAHSTRASYLFIDKELYGRRSGFYGDMFGSDKIDAAIDRIAADIEAHYQSVLEGDPELWAKICTLQRTQVEKPRLP